MVTRRRQRGRGASRKSNAAGAVQEQPRELVLSLTEDDTEETPGSAESAQRPDPIQVQKEASVKIDEADVPNSASEVQEAAAEGQGVSDGENDQCGICLNSESDLVRGKLDSCDHFFCFMCIMHWAQTESKCPLCKQRFQKLSEQGGKSRTFRIPKRDQKYCPTEEETLEILEPYRHISCQVCGDGGQDAFLLLCDRCDSAAHTFCVGFGHQVPDGEWLCGQCLEEGGVAPQVVQIGGGGGGVGGGRRGGGGEGAEAEGEEKGGCTWGEGEDASCQARDWGRRKGGGKGEGRGGAGGGAGGGWE